MSRRSPGQARVGPAPLAPRPKKSLAQHFLKDRRALARIVSAAELSADDIVIEVGPGRGVLTRELAARAQRVIAVEIDAALCQALERDLASAGNVTIVHRDILQTEVSSLLAHLRRGPAPPYKVVANIPYYITGPILRFFLEAAHKPSRLVLLVQKEVAQSIVAGPGQMGILAVSVQLYGRPRIVGTVPARAFHPPPRVDSAVLRIDVYDRPAAGVRDTDMFFRVVRAGFSSPRKQLRNALANGLRIALEDSARLLAEAQIDATRRAETLSLEEWARLADIVRRDVEARRMAGLVTYSAAQPGGFPP